jgi:hypothetical protein
MIRLILILGFFGFAIGLAVIEEYDKKKNYVRVDARVTKVATTCYLEKKEGKSTRTTDVIECDKAELLKQIHPGYAGWDVKYSIKVAYLFTSPADRQAHEGEQTFIAYPEGRKLQYGDLMPVLAHKSEAGKSRSI